jgi:hypothetical protein
MWWGVLGKTPLTKKAHKKSHIILIKRAIQQEGITIINLHAPNISAPNFIKHLLLDLNTVLVGDVNTPLSPRDMSYRQKNQQRNYRIKNTIERMLTLESRGGGR